MPNRIVRDGLLDSETIDSLSDQAYILYTRLLLVADDYGRFDARPALVMSRAFPLRNGKYSAEEVSAWLEELADKGAITLYEVGGRQFLEIGKFNQRIRTSRRKGEEPELIPSKFPAPAGEKSAAAEIAPLSAAQRGAARPRATPPPSPPSPHTHSAPPPAAQNFQMTLDFIGTAFPESDHAMASKIVSIARQADPALDDHSLTALLRRLKQPTQRKAALYLHTVPAALANGKTRAAPAAAQCPDCHGAREISTFTGQTAGDYLRWLEETPEVAQKKPCGRCNSWQMEARSA